MPDKTKTTRGDKRVNKTGAARNRAEDKMLGEAALNEALSRLRATGSIDPTHASSTTGTGSQPHGHATPAPKTVSQLLGEITWLMTQSPRHKAIPLSDLEWLVMPAILLQQFRMFYNGEQPVGVALWALADDFVAKRIDGGDVRLSAAEWKSGPHLRIVDIVAPFGGEAEMRGQCSTQET